MDGPPLPAPSGAANPVLVEIMRGPMVESRHRGAVAVTDAHGRVAISVGDIRRPVYPRSAIKPIQALPLFETGAADAFDVTDPELALACASHNGEAAHVAAVTLWLARIGLSPDDLECGAPLPATKTAQRALSETGGAAAPVYDNCSGKHAGFMTVARHLGAKTKGYVTLTHPVQQRVLGTLEQMTGLDLSSTPRGTDGCGIPVFGIPLGNLALAMARLADPHDQPDARQAACARILGAMAANPFMVAGTARFCTRVIEATAGRVLIKTGAEGVYCGAVPEHGLGIALKIDDGARRAAEVTMGAVLGHLGLLDGAAKNMLADALRPVIQSRAGAPVGEMRPATEAPFSSHGEP
jgi:L-asparaginase II